MYRLIKLSIEDGKYSKVRAGHQVSGKLLYAYLSGMYAPKEIHDLSAVDIDWQIALVRNMGDWINTSPIAEILERTETSVKFRTQTSIYLLEKINDREDNHSA